MRLSQDQQFIWVEKYRPNTLDEYLGNPILKDKMKQYLDEGQIPHLLFHSKSPGTGKSSMSKILVKNLNCDYSYINAASKSGIDDIRNKVTQFVSTKGFKPLKVMILDEAQRMSPDAQRAMLELMETHAGHARFIMTCNNPEKILEPLRSRCQIFHVEPPSKKEVAKHVAGILDKEEVSYEIDDFKILMKYYPDIREIIQIAHQFSTNGKLCIDENLIANNENRLQLLEILKNKKETNDDKLVMIRQFLADLGTGNDFTDYFDLLYDKVDEYAPNNVAISIVTLAEYQHKNVFVSNKELNFAACMVELLKVI